MPGLPGGYSTTMVIACAPAGRYGGLTSWRTDNADCKVCMTSAPGIGPAIIGPASGIKTPPSTLSDTPQSTLRPVTGTTTRAVGPDVRDAGRSRARVTLRG